MKQKRDAYVKRLNGIYERNLGNDKVDHIQGWASFVDKNTIRVQPAEGEAIQIKAKNILIAPGKNIHPPTFSH
jgi:glutathione reductase (NADPH)